MQNVKMIKDFAKPSFFTLAKHKLAAYALEKGGRLGNVSTAQTQPRQALLTTRINTVGPQLG